MTVVAHLLTNSSSRVAAAREALPFARHVAAPGRDVAAALALERDSSIDSLSGEHRQ